MSKYVKKESVINQELIHNCNKNDFCTMIEHRILAIRELREKLTMKKNENSLDNNLKWYQFRKMRVDYFKIELVNGCNIAQLNCLRYATKFLV